MLRAEISASEFAAPPHVSDMRIVCLQIQHPKHIIVKQSGWMCTADHPYFSWSIFKSIRFHERVAARRKMIDPATMNRSEANLLYRPLYD